MATEWKKIKLIDFMEFNPALQIKKKSIAKKIPMEMLLPFTRKISGYELAEFKGGSKFQNGDTLLARITPCLENGKTAFVNILEENEIAFGSTEFIVLRSKKGISDPVFIYYFVTSPFIRDIAIKSMVGSSGRQRVQQTVLENLEVDLPLLEKQQKIAKILSALDEKIELNNKINENLHAQAQAIFKAWFVDFEPFGGTVPSDWEETTLDSMIAISKKAFNPLKNKDIEVEHYSIPAYDESQFPIFENSNDIKSNKFVVVNNSLLLSKLNPTIKRLWKPYCLSEYAVCSTEFIVCLPKNKLYLSFIYSLLDSDNFQDFMKKHVTGSTGSHQRVKPNDILNFSFLKAPDRVIADYCLLVDNMLNKIENNMLENKKLAQIRDTLLPKLMSGELEV